jgi:hypothetical protein
MVEMLMLVIWFVDAMWTRGLGHIVSIFSTEDGDSVFPHNFCIHIQVHMMLQARRPALVGYLFSSQITVNFPRMTLHHEVYWLVI